MSLLAHIDYERRRIVVLRRLAPIFAVGILATVAVSSIMSSLVSSMGRVVAVTPEDSLLFVLARGSMMPVTAGVAAAVLVGSEYRHRTIELTLALTSRRRYAVAAYFIGQGVLAAVLALLGVAVALVVTTTGIPSPGFVLGATGIHLISCVIWATWSTALVLLLQSRGLVVFAVSVWALVIEPAIGGASKLVGGPARTWARYLPYELLDTLTTSLTPPRSVLLASGGAAPIIAVVGVLILLTTALVSAAFIRVIRQRRI